MGCITSPKVRLDFAPSCAGRLVQPVSTAKPRMPAAVTTVHAGSALGRAARIRTPQPYEAGGTIRP